ncbi:MAG: ATP-binding cassette domain-containing protein, partial [Promethearchaeota archaeon]
DIWSYSPEHLYQKVSYVFQNAEEQLVTFSVFDEIAFAAENLCYSPEEIREKVSQTANALGITHLLSRNILDLSGGEKQKVILAASLVMSPKILILDEPLAFLDKNGEKRLVNLLRKLHRIQPDLTIIVVEHRLEPFQTLLNRILLLNAHGKLAFDGTLQEYNQYILTVPTKYLRQDRLDHQNRRILTMEKGETQTHCNLSTLIQLDHLSFQYASSSSPVFSNLSLPIYEGEFVGIIGDNGSGKTTLLYLLARLLSPDTGEISYRDIPYSSNSLDSFLPKIGFIFQNPENQIFETTVKKEILFALQNFRTLKYSPKGKKKQSLEEQIRHKKEEDQICHELLPLIGDLRRTEENLADQNPFCLSWGQKRRLNLASIFSYEPELLLVDEPFIGQDAVAVNRIFKILEQFHQQGKTIVIVSHDQELLQTHCSRIIKLNENQTAENQPSEIQNINNISPLSPIESETIQKPDVKKAPTKNPPKKMRRINSFLKQTAQYTPRDNWLHKLNPVVKLITLVFLTVILFYIRSNLLLMGIFILLLLGAKIAGVSLKKLLRQTRWIVILTLIYIPLNTLFDATYAPDDIVLFYLIPGHFPIRRLALYYSLRVGLLIIIFISTAVIYTETTPPKDMVYSLIQIGVPYRFAFSFMIALRYIPLIERESNIIGSAQILRGMGIRKGTSVKKVFRHILLKITTLLISIIRKAKTTAMAIEARGFGASNRRTNLNKVKWNWEEWLVLFVLLGVGVYVILLMFQFIPPLFQMPSLYHLYQRFFSLNAT